MPESAFNYDSIAALAERSEEEWLDILYGRVADPFERFIDGFFDDIGEGLADGVKFIMALVTRLARALTHGMPALNFGSLAEAFAWLQLQVPIKLTEHTEAILRLDELAAASNTTVAYVGDLQDMVTIGRGQLVCTSVEGAKGQNILSEVDVGTRSSGGDVTALNDLWVRAMPYVRPGASGSIYYVPIVTDRHGIPDKIRWIGGTDNSIFSGTYYEVALCGYNPSNGNLEKVWGSGNIKDTYANTSTLAEIQIDMGLDEEDVAQRIKPGQLLFWAHQQYANGFGQSARSIAAAPQANVARPAGLLLDAACYVAPNFSQGIPSSISFASLTRENRFIPWGAISVKSIPAEGAP